MAKPLPFPGNYQFRRNPLQRILDDAAECRTIAALIDTANVRDSIRPVAARRYMAAALACGLV